MSLHCQSEFVQKASYLSRDFYETGGKNTKLSTQNRKHLSTKFVAITIQGLQGIWAISKTIIFWALVSVNSHCLSLSCCVLTGSASLSQDIIPPWVKMETLCIFPCMCVYLSHGMSVSAHQHKVGVHSMDIPWDLCWCALYGHSMRQTSVSTVNALKCKPSRLFCIHWAYVHTCSRDMTLYVCMYVYICMYLYIW